MALKGETERVCEIKMCDLDMKLVGVSMSGLPAVPSFKPSTKLTDLTVISL